MDTIETKFRAWYENKLHYNVSKMCHGLYWDETGDFNIFAFKNPQNKLMQFTTLKDNNGDDIYESDVVEIDTTGMNCRPEKVNGAVKFIDGCFTVEFEKPVYDATLECNRERLYVKCFTVNKAIKIIGNIFDNPELLSNDA